VVEELADGHAAVRVGAATTNLEMLNWSNESGWTLPIGKLFCTLFKTADDVSNRKEGKTTSSEAGVLNRKLSQLTPLN
jgi:hypothetical protein